MALARRQDWRLRVEIGGVDVTARVISDVEIVAEENAATIATLTVHESGDDIAATAYQFAALVITHEELDAAGALVQARAQFVGVVQTMDADLRRRTLSLRASDQLQASVEGMTRAQVEALTPAAHWHASAYNDRDDRWIYLQQRLSTVAASVHRAIGGAVTAAPWDSAAAPVLTLDASDVLGGSLDAEFGERRDRPDAIRLTVNLRYPRRWRRRVSQSWNYPRSLTEYAQDTTDLPSRAMVETAGERVHGWALVDTAFSPVWPDQVITVGPTNINFTHNQDVFVIGATGEFERTWTQSVTDSIVVLAHAWPAATPPAVPVVIDQTVSIDIDAPEEDEAAPAAPSGTHETSWRYEDDGRAELNDALTAAVARAVRDLQSSYRETIVSGELPCLPAITLADNVTVDVANRLRVTGKVYQYRHRYSRTRATTQLRVAVLDGRHAVSALSSYDGTANPATIDPPAVASFIVPTTATQLAKFGETNTFDDAKIGFAGNYVGGNAPPDAEAYPRRFAFDLPDVPSELRDEHVSARGLSVEVEIPTSNFVLWPA